MTADKEGEKRGVYLPVAIDAVVLGHYRDTLGLPDNETAWCTLARAIAGSPVWEKMSPAALVMRWAPPPLLAVLGFFTREEIRRLTAQVQAAIRACGHLRYVSYRQAEQDCARLAEQLVSRFGRGELRRFHFAAIPRGGHIVLGMLAYMLDLPRGRLTADQAQGVPWVVVDDCMLSGVRFTHFLEGCGERRLISAHLYSHPDLRAAVLRRYPQVIACLAAADLHDVGSTCFGENYAALRKRHLDRLDGARCWFGYTEHVCFAWNEPDRSVWSEDGQDSEPAWHLVPPDLCLKHRTAARPPIAIQHQPEARGPLKPAADVIFGDVDQRVIIARLATGETFGLTEVAADMWRALIENGNPQGIVDALLANYDVAESVLREDVRTFIEGLAVRGLVDRGEAPVSGEGGHKGPYDGCGSTRRHPY